MRAGVSVLACSCAPATSEPPEQAVAPVGDGGAYTLWMDGQPIGNGVVGWDAGVELTFVTWLPPGADRAQSRRSTVRSREDDRGHWWVEEFQSTDEHGVTRAGERSGTGYAWTEAGRRMLPLEGVSGQTAIGIRARCAASLADGDTCDAHWFDPITATMEAVTVGPCAQTGGETDASGTRCWDVASASGAWRWWWDDEPLPVAVVATHGSAWVRDDVGADDELRARILAGSASSAAVAFEGEAPAGLAYRPRLVVSLSGAAVGALEVDALDGGRQSVERQPDGGIRLTIVRESRFRALPWPGPVAAPDDAQDAFAIPDPAVAARAQQWALGATDVRSVVVQLTDALGRVVTAARVTGPSSPGATLARGVGDCTEQSALLVALLQSLGVPARVVVGVAALEGAWRPHAWVEYADASRVPGEVGTTWRTADPSFGEVPASVDRIRLSVGLDAFARLATASSLLIRVEDGTFVPTETP